MTRIIERAEFAAHVGLFPCRSGHLMQGRLGASIVEEDGYILTLKVFLQQYWLLAVLFCAALRKLPFGVRSCLVCHLT